MDAYTIIGGDQKEYGPVSADDIKAWLREGRADAHTRVRKNAGEWGTLGALPEFASLPEAPATATQGESLPASRMELAMGKLPRASAAPSPSAASGPAADTGVVQAVFQPLSRATGWMKFLAVVMFIYAGFNILSIWGILICWIPIWMGLLLLRSANLINASMADGSPATAVAATTQLKTFFVLLGVLMLVTFLATGFIILIVIAFGLGMS